MSKRPHAPVKDEMLACQSSLRAAAISLCGNIDRADDLVQETFLRAWANIEGYTPGTNMGAWLFVILRNLFRGQYRKLRHEVADINGMYAESLFVPSNQDSRLDLIDFAEAFGKLPATHREAVTLIGVSGCSYAEAARIARCSEGTIKSRLSRARVLLYLMLADEDGEYVHTKMLLVLQKRLAAAGPSDRTIAQERKQAALLRERPLSRRRKRRRIAWRAAHARPALELPDGVLVSVLPPKRQDSPFVAGLPLQRFEDAQRDGSSC